jgi:thiamine kinase-like enzyme
MDFERVIGVRNDKTIYRHKAKVIKVFNDHYKKSQIMNEALNISKVEETELCVPELLAVKKIEDKWSIELSYIKGKSLQRLMQENPNLVDDYLKTFVSLQESVFACKAPILTKMRDKMGQKIDESPLVATKRMRLRMKLSQFESEMYLCHGDFFPANIILSESDSYYIIDWAHASIGHKAADIANSYLNFWIEFDKDMAEKYLDIYLQSNQGKREDVMAWMPIVAAARSNRGIKQERDFLMNLVNSSLEGNYGY